MKHGFRMRLIFLLCALALIVCLPALAGAAETTRYVSNDAELQQAVTDANAAGMSAHENGGAMDWMTIVVTNDIVLTNGIGFDEGTRVRITSEENEQHTITCPGGDGWGFFISNAGDSKMEISNLIFDGTDSESAFLGLLSASAHIGPNVIIENFTIDYFWPMISGFDIVGDYEDISFSMEDVIFRNNKAIDGTTLINISSSKIKMDFDDCTFENNFVEDTHGGVMRLYGEANITNCTFENNKALGGGAIFAMGADLTLTNTTFKNNQAVYPANPEGGDGGGALHFQSGTTATITNCDFIGNYTDISGGAVTAFVDTEVTFTGCNFLNNEAATHGGAICVADSFSKENPKPSKIFLYDCLMEGNKAMGEDQSNEHNSDPLAPGGGAIYLHEYCEATLGSGTILQKNYAKDSGGAVYVCFGGRLECDGAQILDNESGLDGGGVYVDGTNAYSGYDHSQTDFAPGPDDGYAEGGQFDFVQGIITGNLAGRNGGGVYIGGENEVIVNDERHLYTGGKLYMTGGVITENKAQDMGGGVYVGSCDTASKLNPGGILQMVDGAIYLNIAGENGNTSTGADDAGADVYCEGEYAYISVVSANAITAYVRNRNMPFVPEEHHTLYFTNWYDDYSDQDPTYGKTENKIGTGVNTGRYTSSIEPDRMVYAPYTMDDEYNALILDYDLKPLPETGDTTPLALWVMLALCSAAGLLLLRRRHA